MPRRLRRWDSVHCVVHEFLLIKAVERVFNELLGVGFLLVDEDRPAGLQAPPYCGGQSVCCSLEVQPRKAHVSALNQVDVARPNPD